MPPPEPGLAAKGLVDAIPVPAPRPAPSSGPPHPDDWFTPPRPPEGLPARRIAMGLLLRRLLRRRVRIRAGGHRLRGVLIRVRAEYATLAAGGRPVRMVHVVLRHIVAVELE